MIKGENHKHKQRESGRTLFLCLKAGCHRKTGAVSEQKSPKLTAAGRHLQSFLPPEHPAERKSHMSFFTSAVTALKTIVIALGAGLCIWGGINLLEGYGNDNPGANAHVR